MDYKEIQRGYQERVEKLLLEYAPSDKSGYHDVVNEAMKYSLMAGGKRIRPTIVLATYDMFKTCTNVDVKRSKSKVKAFDKGVEAFAVALEMIHTYSLIHDDLPAMDNDDLRRGKATCHIKFGEDMAILAGDGLLNRAFEVMLESIATYDLGMHGVNAAKCLGEKAGTRGMIGGQVADITYENKPTDIDVIGYIHQHKTSALLEASFMMGGYLAGASNDHIGKLMRIGRSIGLAFQIQDDLLDVTSTEEVLGKPIGSDKENNKTTYVDLKGIDGSVAVVKDLLNEAETLLDAFKGCDVSFLLSFVDYIRNRSY